MKIEYEGETYEYDPDDLSVKQAGKIERHIWRGNLDQVTAGVQIQLELLAQRNPSVDTGPLRQAVTELVSLAERTGGNGTLLEWEQGMLQARSDCIQALAWLLINDGRQVPIADTEVKVIKMHRALITAMQAAAPDPTPPAAREANGRTSRVPSPAA